MLDSEYVDMDVGDVVRRIYTNMDSMEVTILINNGLDANLTNIFNHLLPESTFLNIFKYTTERLV